MYKSLPKSLIQSLRSTNSKKLGRDMFSAQVMKDYRLFYSSNKNEDIIFPYYCEQGIYMQKELMSSKGYQTSSR